MAVVGLALRTALWPLAVLPSQTAFHRAHDRPELCHRPSDGARSGRDEQEKNTRRKGREIMTCPRRSLGLILAAAVVMPALGDGLKDEIAPTGKLRVAIAISLAGGAFWSTKTGDGYAGVPVDLGREMAGQLGVPVE